MSKIINVIDVLDNKISLEDAKSMIIMHKGEAYTYFDEGLTRHVYANADKTKVIKLNMRESGINYNQMEIDIYTNASEESKEQMVETTISNNLIEQEFVTPIKFGGKKLTIQKRWFDRSCRKEVGWTVDGKLQCF